MEPETECVNLSEEDINEILNAAKDVNFINETVGEITMLDCCLVLGMPLILNSLIYFMDITHKLGVVCGILTIGWIFSVLFLLAANKLKYDQTLDFINEKTSFCKHGTVCNKIECPFFHSGKCELGHEVIFHNETDSYISQKME